MNTVVRFCCCKKGGRKSIFGSPLLPPSVRPFSSVSPLTLLLLSLVLPCPSFPHLSPRSMPCLQIEPNFLPPQRARERGSDLPVRARPTERLNLRWVSKLEGESIHKFSQPRPRNKRGAPPSATLLDRSFDRSLSRRGPRLPRTMPELSCPQCNPPPSLPRGTKAQEESSLN